MRVLVACLGIAERPGGCCWGQATGTRFCRFGTLFSQPLANSIICVPPIIGFRVALEWSLKIIKVWNPKVALLLHPCSILELKNVWCIFFPWSPPENKDCVPAIKHCIAIFSVLPIIHDAALG